MSAEVLCSPRLRTLGEEHALQIDSGYQVIERRTLLRVIAGGLLAAPLAAQAQQAGKVYRIGSLVAVMPPNPQGQGPFYDRMRELGWVHGQNFVVERRAYGDQPERLPDLAAELVRSGVDVLIVTGVTDARRVQQATRTVPIVASDAADLVQAGLAVNLARPGGNVTGVQTLMPEVAGKQVALLKEVIPGLSRTGVLMGSPDLSEADLRAKAFGPSLRAVETSSTALGIRLQLVNVDVHRAEDLATAFSAFRSGRAQGILVLRSPFIGSHQKTVTDLAIKYRLPTISDLSFFARDGGLVSYGYDGREVSRLLADTVDQILRGARASDVPVRQVTEFRLIFNLKTAKALGLTIPPSLLQRADQVIE